jgi:hypothetical protein
MPLAAGENIILRQTEGGGVFKSSQLSAKARLFAADIKKRPKRCTKNCGFFGPFAGALFFSFSLFRRLNHGQQLRFGGKADGALLLLPILQHDNSGDAHHAETAGDPRDLIYIDLAHQYVRSNLAIQLFNHRREHFAGATPVRIKINESSNPALLRLRKGFFRKMLHKFFSSFVFQKTVLNPYYLHNNRKI